MTYANEEASHAGTVLVVGLQRITAFQAINGDGTNASRIAAPRFGGMRSSACNTQPFGRTVHE
jgi:hypothetical protein